MSTEQISSTTGFRERTPMKPATTGAPAKEGYEFDMVSFFYGTDRKTNMESVD
jgi:hypothetical protein